jgi:exosortase
LLSSLRWMTSSWFDHPYYSHGLAILVTSLLLAILFINNSPPKQSNKAQVIRHYLLACVLIIIGNRIRFSYLICMSFFFFLSASINLLSKRVNTVELQFPILLMISVIPFPFLPELTAILQLGMVKAVDITLNLLQFNIYTEGVMIYLPNDRFYVGAPSSGIRSFLILPTIMLILARYTNTTTLKKVSFFTISVLITLIGNFSRILSIVTSGYFIGSQKAYDLWHETGNSIYFIFTFSILIIIWYKLSKNKNGRIKLRQYS